MIEQQAAERSSSPTTRKPSAGVRWRSPGRWAPVLAAVYPVVEVIRILANDSHRYLYGDSALIELGARRAARFDQLVGVYSRLGFHEPGPMLFYILAPFVTLMGSGPGSYLGSMVLSGASLVVLVALIGRWVSGWAAMWAAGSVAVFCLCVRVFTLREPWNPYEVVAPMALLAVLSAGATLGRRGALVWAAVVASFETQTHIATAVTSAAFVAVPLVAGGVRSWRARRRVDLAGVVAPGEPAPGWRVAGLAVLVLAWVPTVIDWFTGRPSNVRLLWDFYTAPHPYPPLHQVLKAAANAVAIVPFGNSDYVTDMSHPRHDLAITATLLAVCWIVTIGLARRGRQLFPVALVGASMVIVVVGTASLTRAAGGIEPYFVTWMAVAPLLAMLGLGVALFPAPGVAGAPPARHDAVGSSSAWRAPAHAAVAVLAVVASGLVVRSDLRMQSTKQVFLLPQLAAARFAAVAESHLGQPRRVGVWIVTDDEWPAVAGMVLELDRRGISVTVAPATWGLEFGSQTAPGPAVGAQWSFYSYADWKKIQPRGTVVSYNDGVVMVQGPPPAGALALGGA